MTFDPDGDEPIVVRVEAMECPMDVEDFEVRWSCGDVYLDRHEVELEMNGLLKLALDFLSCSHMGHAPGCSWDRAIDRFCDAVFDDPWLGGECEDLIEDLVIDDPCFEPHTLRLAGAGAVVGDRGGQLAGDWAGTLHGDDFTGTFTATSR